MPTGLSSPLKERRRLDAWKAIAQYLGRDVTTVRRRERREGLPVHRHQHARLGSVYAFTDEIDEWLRRRSDGPQVLEPQPRPVVQPAVLSAAPVSFSQPRRRMLRPAFGLALVLVATAVMSS